MTTRSFLASLLAASLAMILVATGCSKKSEPAGKDSEGAAKPVDKAPADQGDEPSGGTEQPSDEPAAVEPAAAEPADAPADEPADEPEPADEGEGDDLEGEGDVADE